MDRFVANQHQYLVVQYRDGHKEHIKGPRAVFLNPIVHEEIEVKNSIQVDSFECIVVHSESAKGDVERRVVRGPMLFTPGMSHPPTRAHICAHPHPCSPVGTCHNCRESNI